MTTTRMMAKMLTMERMVTLAMPILPQVSVGMSHWPPTHSQSSGLRASPVGPLGHQQRALLLEMGGRIHAHGFDKAHTVFLSSFVILVLSSSCTYHQSSSLLHFLFLSFLFFTVFSSFFFFGFSPSFVFHIPLLRFLFLQVFIYSNFFSPSPPYSARSGNKNE